MGRIADLMAEGAALLAQCATEDDARAQGRTFGQRAVADVTQFEADTGQRHGIHRWDVSNALLNELQAAEAAQAALVIRFYWTARNTYRAELNALG